MRAVFRIDATYIGCPPRMATVTDPYEHFASGNTWGGATGQAPASPGDDTLIYRLGSDVVDGLTGYDILVIPFSQADSVIGNYANGVVSIAIDYIFLKSPSDPQYDSHITMNLTAVNIEQLQFTDGVITLQERPTTSAPPAGASTGVADPVISGGNGGIKLSRNEFIETEFSLGSSRFAVDPSEFDIRRRKTIKNVRTEKQYDKAVKKNRHAFVYNASTGYLFYDSNPKRGQHKDLDVIAYLTNEPPFLATSSFEIL